MWKRKSKQTQTETVRREWEQTLVAEGTEPVEAAPEAIEPAPEEPLELLEPSAEELPMEPIPEVVETPVEEVAEPTIEDVLEPAPEPEPLEIQPSFEEPAVDVVSAPNVEPALQPYVRAEGEDLVLKEPFLTQAQRLDLERRIARGKKVTLSERRWIPSRPESPEEIERSVDNLAFNGKYVAKSAEWIKRVQAERRTALKGLERIPPNILSKRIVYETEGGFVVEITYAELGQVLRKYFTIPSQGTPQKTLEHVREGQWGEVVSVSDDLIQSLESTGHHKASVPPGKVYTWPIENRHPVWDIPQISKKRTAQLAKIGISTTDQLRVHAPIVVARHVKVPLRQAEKWMHEAELLIVKGIARDYAYLLASSGVKGLDDLRGRTPADLAAAVNARLAKHPVRGLPKQIGNARAAGWIKAANRLKKKVQPFPAAA